MKHTNLLIYLLLLVLIIGCKGNRETSTEKFQKHRDKIINVKDKITDIKTDVLFGISNLNILDDMLIVSEIKPGGDQGIHLFNKNTFEYIASAGIAGRGPGEITRQGTIAVDNKNKILWVSDYGKMVLWKFPIDSILNNSMFLPTEKIDLGRDLFVERYGFLNDSTVLGKAVRVLSSNKFDMVTAKRNLKTNLTEVFGYEHADAVGKKSNSYFKLSVKNGIYVNCYVFCDLMTICDLEGNLRHNIYGPDALDNRKNKNAYFHGVDIFDNHIIASYIGGDDIRYDEFNRPEGNLPSKFLLFDLDGNYQETIETGSGFEFFCVDEENHRVIAYFADRENPLGYFSLSNTSF